MKKRNLKFALLLQDGKPVRSLEELKMYYDIDRILAYFQNGQLERWLEQNEYIREYELIQNLKDDMKNYMEKSVNGILLNSKEPDDLLHSSVTKVQNEIISNVGEDILGDTKILDDKITIDKVEIEPNKVEENLPQRKENLVEEKPKEKSSVNEPVVEKTTPSLFRKPLKTGDDEIYGKAMTERQERFSFKNKFGKIEKENEVDSLEFKISKSPSIPRISDDDFFNDDFFMDDSVDEDNNIIEEPKENLEIQKNIVKDESIVKEETTTESVPPQNFEISTTEKKKLNFGLGSLGGVGNGASASNKPKKGLGLGLNSNLNLNYSDTEIEDNRRQLLEMKKKSVFSKLKAENPINPVKASNNVELSRDEASSAKEQSKENFDMTMLHANIEKTVQEISEIKSSISASVVKSEYEDEKKKFIEDKPIEDNLEKIEDIHKDESTEIDIQSLIEKINSNVEKNAKLIEEADINHGANIQEELSENSEEQKRSEILENKEIKDNHKVNNMDMMNTLAMNKISREEKMTIGVNPKLNTEHSLLHNNEEPSGKKFVDFEKLNHAESKQKSNEIPESVKSYKATVYSQQEYEEVIKRRKTINTKLRIIVSFSGLKVSEENINIEYIGINKPTIILLAEEVFNCNEHSIWFSGLRLSAEKPIMIFSDRLDNCTFDKTKIKKGINDLMEKYPSMMSDMQKAACLLNAYSTDLESEITVEKYIDEIYQNNQGEVQIMATVQLTGLRIFTDLSMGVINMAFYKDHLGKIHDISDIFNNMESIDIFKRDVAIGIEFMALITQEMVEAVEKEQNKKYQSTLEVLEDIFKNEDMYHYLEYVMIAPVRILNQTERINRIDQAKIIDIMDIDTGIPFIYEIFQGPLQVVKKNLMNFIEMAEETARQNGIDFKGVSIECVNDEEWEIEDSICYEFTK